MNRWFRFLYVFLCLVCGFVWSSAAQATDFGILNINFFRQQVSTTSDVVFTLQTPTGINGPSITLDIYYPLAFNFNDITASDIRMTYGPTTGLESTAVISSAEGPGVWGYHLLSGRLQFVPPTDAGIGTIPAGSKIILTMGGTVGTHTITTPASPGDFEFFIVTNAGDFGTGHVLIRGRDSLEVVATVAAATSSGTSTPSTPPGGGGTSSDPTDTTPPIIRGLRAENITTSSAMIRWTTNELSNGIFTYRFAGASGDLGSRTESGSALIHEIPLTGLEPGRSYTLRLNAWDAYFNRSLVASLTFSTLAMNSVVPSPLVISGVRVVYVDDHQVIIEWNTNKEASGEVRLETTPLIMGTTPSIARTQRLQLAGLAPLTSYSFLVTAKTMEGETATVRGFSFTTTGDVTPPSNVSNFRGIYQGPPSTVTLLWNNPTDADFQDVIVTRIDVANGNSVQTVCVTAGESCVTQPPAGATRLMYRIVARDRAGNESSGSIATVQVPVTPVIDPPIVTTTTRTGTEPAPTTQPTASTTQPTLPTGTGTTTTTDVLPPILVPTTTASTAEQLVLIPEFFLTDTIQASVNAEGVRSVLSGRTIQIRLPVVGTESSLSQAQIQTSDGSIYQFAYRDALGAFVADLLLPQETVDPSIQIQAISADGRRWEGRFTFALVQEGRISDGSDRNRSVPVAQASVELLNADTGAAILRTETTESGRYAAIVPNGRYRLRVYKEGLRPYDQLIDIENNLLVRDVQLLRGLQPLSAAIDTKAPLSQNIAAIGSEIALAVQLGLEAIRQPEVQSVTENVAAPAAVVVAVGVTAIAVGGFNLLNYLQFLFTQPFLLIYRRKRKSWGVVYNALSKQPIELAVVRLMKPGTNFALQTHITDAQGRFAFFVPAGSYTIQVQKPGYQFPTTYLKDEKIDVDLVDLYHGEEIKVTGPVTISPNIPLDPTAKEELPAVIQRRQRLRKVQSIISLGGLVAGLVAVVISPTPFVIGMAVFQVALYGLFRRLAIPARPKRWGIVYDTDGKRPLVKTVVRVFDKKFNKLLETQITNADGTYGFFAAKGQYYLTAEKPGYERYLSGELDLTKAKDTYIDHRFALKRTASPTN